MAGGSRAAGNPLDWGYRSRGRQLTPLFEHRAGKSASAPLAAALSSRGYTGYHCSTAPQSVRRFHLNRHDDVTGVSGTGIVAQGVQFDNGKVALTWLTERSSVTIYDSLIDLEAVHLHHGATSLVWEDAAH